MGVFLSGICQLRKKSTQRSGNKYLRLGRVQKSLVVLRRGPLLHFSGWLEAHWLGLRISGKRFSVLLDNGTQQEP